jgi:hypothetical protein
MYSLHGRPVAWKLSAMKMNEEQSETPPCRAGAVFYLTGNWEYVHIKLIPRNINQRRGSWTP